MAWIRRILVRRKIAHGLDTERLLHGSGVALADAGYVRSRCNRAVAVR
jgi:hypothetical protein